MSAWPRLIHAYWNIGVVWGDATLYPLKDRRVVSSRLSRIEPCPMRLPAKAAGRPRSSTPFHGAKINSLRYNTSQAGSAIPLAYGTCRVSVNLIELWGFSGSKGGGKGGKGLGSSAGKKGSNQSYSVDVAFGLCQGPVSFTGAAHGIAGNNRIWSNGGIAAGLAQVGLNGYAGNDGQAADPVFASADPNTPVVGYSGTCYVTGTPMQLGSTPALPKSAFEIAGFETGTAGPELPGRRAARRDRLRPIDQSALRRRLSRRNLDRRRACRLGQLLPGGAARDVAVDRPAAALRPLARGDRTADRIGGGVVGLAVENHPLRRPAAIRQRRVAGPPT